MKAPAEISREPVKVAIARMFYGFVGGFFAVAALITLLNSSGSLLLTGDIAQLIGGAYYYIQTNLGASLYLFALVLLGYFHSLSKLGQHLRSAEPELDRVIATEERVDLAISLFFGIGVLWTAIGMRDALVSALGDMDATAAAAQGAWEILRRLVDGGILIALTTTIIGGFGGFSMRLLKVFLVGSRIKQLHEEEARRYEDEVLSELSRIAQLLEEDRRSRSDSSSVKVVEGVVD